MKYSISYIIATRNRLSFLKITLEKLLGELQADEEIVIVDGNSTDGSKEYLQTLFSEGKIHQFISEPDRNQAHAWNKAMLMSNGEIIKKIIDDDVFCYQAIRTCKNHMLSNPGIDVVISNDLGSSLNDYKDIRESSRLSQFENWKKGLAASFTFGDVHLLVRKSALSYIGFYNPGFVMMDWEYSLRISYLKADIAYYTGYNALSVSHPGSISSLKNVKLIKDQGKRGSVFYEYAGDNSEISAWSKIKIVVGKTLYDIMPGSGPKNNEAGQDIESIYNYLYEYIAERNNSTDFVFL